MASHLLLVSIRFQQGISAGILPARPHDLSYPEGSCHIGYHVQASNSVTFYAGLFVGSVLGVSLSGSGVRIFLLFFSG